MTTAAGAPSRTANAGHRVARNFSWLLTGRIGAAALSLGAVVLAARALGPETFGTIMLVHTTALIIKQLCNIKSSDAAVRFGAPLLEDGRHSGAGNSAWRTLMGALRRLDLITALLAGLIGALALAFGAAPLGLAAEFQDVTWLYVAALFCTATGTAKGALRALDRYPLLSVMLLARPSARLGGVLVCMALEAPAAAYLLVWALGFMLEELLLLAGVAGLLGAPNQGAPMRPALQAHPRLAPFLKVVYWQSNLDLFPQHVAILAVGGLFGADSAGIYRLVRDIAQATEQPVMLVRQAIFPDLSRLWEGRRSAFLALTWRVCALGFVGGGGLFLVALLFGGDLLAALAGEAFRAGAPLLALVLAAGGMELSGGALRPASYAMDKANTAFVLQAISVVLFFAVLYGAEPLAGLNSAGWAALGSAAFSLGGMIWLVHRTANQASGP